MLYEFTAYIAVTAKKVLPCRALNVGIRCAPPKRRPIYHIVVVEDHTHCGSLLDLI